MKKIISDFVITDNLTLNSQYYLLKLTANLDLSGILPGQFAQVRIDNSSTTFLRRPISICYVNKSTNELWLLIQKVGDGTHKLSLLKRGDSLNLILPLGNSFTQPIQDKEKAKVLLVGGGVGVAPLLMWGATLSAEQYQVDFLLGARTANDLLLLDEFQKYGTLYLTTEDASMGEKGFVIHHSVLKNKQFDTIYTCGPTPMMKAVASYANKQQILCQVSLENMMACGIGACLCCVTDTVKEGNVCVCTDGPIFNTKNLKWLI